MNSIWLLTSRNLRLFFRDRIGVFFSLLSAIILIALYALFLGGLQVDSIRGSFPQAPERDVHWFVDSWVFAGITMITTLTTAIAGLGVFVDDNVTGRFRDFMVSPIRRSQVVLGYLIAGFIISVTMTTIIIVIGQVYLITQGHPPLTPGNLATTFGFVLLSSGTFSALGSFIVTYLNTAGAFTAVSTVIGSLIGFFSGAYVPSGTLPAGVVTMINALPFAQAAMLIRRPYTDQAAAALAGSDAHALAEIRDFYGMTANIGTLELTTGLASLALVAVFALFLSLGVWRLSNKIR